MEKQVEILKDLVKEIVGKEFKTLSEKLETIEKLTHEFEERMKDIKPERKGILVDDADVKEFKSVNELLEHPAKDGSLVEYFQDLNDKIVLLSQLLRKDPRELKLYKELDSVVKTLTASGAGTGAEFIPTGYSAKLYDEIKLQLQVAKIFNWINMTQPSWVIPVSTGGAVAYKAGEGTDLSTLASTPGTANKTLQVSKLSAYIEVSTEFEEDSIIPALDFIKNQITKAIAEGIENALINGDVDGSLDADNTSTSDQRRVFDGLRELTSANAKVDCGGAIPTIEDFVAIMKKLGKYAVDRNKLYWIISPATYFALLDLKDSAGNRVFRYLAENDPLIKGAVGRILGIPVILSEKVRTDLNASGVYDGTTTDKTIVLLVRPDNFLGGERRALKVQVAAEPKKDIDYVVATYRVGFVKIRDNEDFVALGYNVAY